MSGSIWAEFEVLKLAKPFVAVADAALHCHDPLAVRKDLDVPCAVWARF
jgi:hypothetical protein